MTLRNRIHSYKAKPKKGRLKHLETKQGLLREQPKNAPLRGRFGSLWKTEGEGPNLACSGKVFRPWHTAVSFDGHTVEEAVLHSRNYGNRRDSGR